MRERASDMKFPNRHDSKYQYQCSLCQFRSNHPRFIEQHIEANHTKHTKTTHQHHHHHHQHQPDVNSQQQVEKVVHPNFSSHPNFNPNRLYYCSLCYRGYRWRYDVKRHHKTMHETSDDELIKGRNFHYLEYVPHLDSLISATMSSINNQFKHDNELETNNNHHHHNHPMNDEEDYEDDLKLSIADARTVDVNDEEAAALLMIEPDKSNSEPILIDDHPEDSVIVFEEDRIDKSSSSNEPTKLPSSSSRPIYKPFRCPYCFYRTNWRTDCLRHIRARHKIEPHHNGYYEMSSEKAEQTYDEYERTYGFVVSKKVLARFTDFRQIEWEDLKRSIWEKIKDKTDFEQCIFDRLQPDDYTPTTNPSATTIQPIIIPVQNKITNGKVKRIFTCTECAFRSHKFHELERHVCSRILKVRFLNIRRSFSVFDFRFNKKNHMENVFYLYMNAPNVHIEQ